MSSYVISLSDYFVSLWVRLMKSPVRPRVRDTPQSLSIEHLFDRLEHPLGERPVILIVCREDRLEFMSPF
jgi:hypothetical protein